jgi:hypothetical protein
MILDDWEGLGLPRCPDTGDNGVHASASPLEALFERMNWLGVDPATDTFGAGLIASGISVETLRAWSQDPSVAFEGNKQSLFDLHEDLDASACLKRAVAVNAAGWMASML